VSNDDLSAFRDEMQRRGVYSRRSRVRFRPGRRVRRKNEHTMADFRRELVIKRRTPKYTNVWTFKATGRQATVLRVNVGRVNVGRDNDSVSFRFLDEQSVRRVAVRQFLADFVKAVS